MTIAIHQIRLIDGTGVVRDHMTLLVRGTKILAVGPRNDVSIPKAATRIDGRGLTVIPGLIDCHVHLCLGGEADVVSTLESEQPSYTLLKSARHAQATIEAGFTTVRDVGSRDHSIFSLKHAIDSGLLPGPRIVGSGLAICMIGGHARFIGQEVEGVDQVRKAVDQQISAGAGVIKVIASGGVLTPGTSPDDVQMTTEEISAAVDAARQAGKPVAAHAHGASGMKHAILAGARSIEHATLLDEESGALMKRYGVYMVPTLSALATTAACRPSCGIPESALAKAKAMTKRHKASFKQAYDNDIFIAMGTDAGTPFNYHGENAQELERMVALGMSPMDTIITSTATAARLIGIQDSVGILKRGMEADLVIMQGNPLRRIEILRDRGKIVGVMKAGRFVAGQLAKT
ncbi:MAG TPA: amidohydrolase family protein [Nitrospira sp.]|nr:amidohydrolase family protein [Nitrospira sp.]